MNLAGNTVKLASSDPGAFSGHVVFWFNSTLGEIVYLQLFHIHHTYYHTQEKRKNIKGMVTNPAIGF